MSEIGGEDVEPVVGTGLLRVGPINERGGQSEFTQGAQISGMCGHHQRLLGLDVEEAQRPLVDSRQA